MKLFNNTELKNIVQGSPCAFEAWLFVYKTTHVTKEQQFEAIQELKRRLRTK